MMPRASSLAAAAEGPCGPLGPGPLAAGGASTPGAGSVGRSAVVVVVVVVVTSPAGTTSVTSGGAGIPVAGASISGRPGSPGLVGFSPLAAFSRAGAPGL